MEAAIVLTVIVIPLTFTVISYAYMFSFRQALSQAASEGARAAVGASTTLNCASTDPTTYTAATCPAQYYAVQGIQNSLSNYTGMTCHDPAAASPTSLTCSVGAPTTTGCTTGHSCITVQVSFPYRDHPLLPSIPFTGWTLPPDLTFKSVVEVS